MIKWLVLALAFLAGGVVLALNAAHRPGADGTVVGGALSLMLCAGYCARAAIEIEERRRG